MGSLRKYRTTILFIIDILIIFIAYLISSFLLTNTNEFFTEKNMEALINAVIISLFTYQIVFNLLGLYRNITRYETGKDYLSYIIACGLSGIIVVFIDLATQDKIVNYKQIILSAFLIAVATVSYRVIIRFILTGEIHSQNKSMVKKNLLIIGAGEAAREIIKTIKTSLKDSYNLIGLIDDNPNKKNFYISGVKILGDRYQIPETCKQNNIDVIFFSIANINALEKREILNLCQETGAKIRILPSTADLIRNKSILQNLRDVEIDDILGREPIVLDNENIENLIQNQSILVTGGGGSIGSELCRQIVKYNPKKLIIFDIYENNLYDIEMELKQNKVDKYVQIIPIVGSVRDKNKLEKVFEEYRPYLVFHAAAHKHVPLMETSPLEAIKNNVFGTYNVTECSDKYGVKRFILISTDKAVNPTNIMGATKRMCEMIIQAKNSVSNTEYVAVRFGNVLGSNGSVVPLFKKQIISGGPVTVTHKDITRFFMTIPEAVGLVLQAMSYAKGGEIFVLDMGQPVKIYDLAVSLIKLSGLEPEKDIQIEITGLRQGEKLYEELLMSEEGLTKTEHDKIFIGKLQKINNQQVEESISELREIIKDEEISISELKQKIKKFVPTYKEPIEVNEKQEEQHNRLKPVIQILKKQINNENKQAVV